MIKRDRSSQERQGEEKGRLSPKEDKQLGERE